MTAMGDDRQGEGSAVVRLPDLIDQVIRHVMETVEYDVAAGLDRFVTWAGQRPVVRPDVAGPGWAWASGRPVFGREPERDTLADALVATRTGTGGSLVLTGPAGIGKSSLVAFAVGHARGLGIPVAAGRATELDRVAPLTTLLTALQAARPEPLDLSGIKDHDESQFWFIDRLGEALETYAARSPLMVVIDDAQWADEFSALALRVLVPGLASSPVRWLLARRSVPTESPAQAAIDWLVGADTSERRLGPLDPSGMEQLSAHVLRATADDSIRALIRRAQGNPFLLEQLLLAMSSAGQIATSGGVARVTGHDLPAGFVAAVQQRLRGLSPAAGTLLSVGSLFGRPFTVHAAARLAGMRASELFGAAQEALTAGILVAADDRLVFVHELVREAVYDHIPAPVRAAMHRDAAAVVRSEGCSPVEIAEHLVQSGTTGDQEAVRMLRAAAAEVSARAPGTAADLTLRALNMLGDHDRQRSGVAADAVRLLALAGRLTEARTVGETALLGRLDPTTEATTLLGLAEALKHAGQNEAAASYAARALARPGVPERIQAGLHAIAAHALLWGDDLAKADAAGAAADRIGMACGEHSAAVFGLTARSVVARAEGDLTLALARAGQAVELADRAGGAARHRHPRIWYGAALHAVDRIDEAMVAFTVGRQEAERLGTAWSVPLWHFYLASALLAVGDLDSATAEAEAGQSVAAGLTAAQMSMPLLGLLTRIAVLRDQRPLARRYLRSMQALLDQGVTAAPEDLAWALASIHESEAKPDLALKAMTGLYDQLPGRMLLYTNDPGRAARMVRIALQAGDHARATAAADAAQSLADRNPTIPGLAGMAAHARGLLTDDLGQLRAAVDAYRTGPRPLDRAHALEDCALAERDHGDRPRAVELLEAAITEYRAAGAHRYAKRADQSLRLLGIRRAARTIPTGSTIAGLTEAELNVARRVAEGLTNRQVGDELFISHHTVDSHLRKAFQKMGVQSRLELTRLLIRFETP